MNKKPTITFFGTDDVAIAVLDQLIEHGFAPDIIVTQPDKPQGRKLQLTPPPVKIWAKEHNIDVLQPEKLDKNFIQEINKKAHFLDKDYDMARSVGTDTDFDTTRWDLFIVASYGVIIPEKILDIPKYKTLNFHPSLLPLYRGPSPIEQAILDDAKETGVTIMRMDKEMDHGPIINQEFMYFEKWPDAPQLRIMMATEGGKLLVATIPDWIAGNIDEQEQEHDMATFTKLISKKDGEISLENDPYKNYLKYKAYKPWPGVFFFDENNKRIKITKAEFINGKFRIIKIIPEGKKEVEYKNFK